MKTRIITKALMQEFCMYLSENEKSQATIEKYSRDLHKFSMFANGHSVTKQLTIRYKEHLADKYAATSANSMIAALNAFLKYAGWADCCIRRFKVQKQAYCEESKELSRAEYERLVCAAERNGNSRLSLIIQTICGTGIRVSELQFITVEALKCGEASIKCKGKIRKVFIVKALRKKLLIYAGENGILSGAVFVTLKGKPVDRCWIWRQMKTLCRIAKVTAEKVFPHNLRHLFARIFYELERDIAKLADVLGHSNINTTRIYIVTTGTEHKRKLEKMKLII